jgi:signal transduction histidine kinase
VVAKEISQDIRAALLNPRVWVPTLSTFAAATNLAVLLTDTEGRALGDCLNPRPTWSMLQAGSQARHNCPFCVLPSLNGRCVSSALEAAKAVTTSAPSGLVHVAIPLFLFNQPMGALITGQVFDRYPDSLLIHNVARKLNLSSEKLWECARSECPMRKETLLTYARLLENLGNAFLQAQYQRLTDAELAAEKAKQTEMTDRILDETRQELMRITSQLVSAQEEERESLARELHDGIGQDVIAIQFDVHILQKAIPSKMRQELAVQFDALTEQISQVVRSVRQLSHELHPSILIDLSFEEVVRELADRLEMQCSIAVRVSAQNVSDIIDPTVALGLYRIIREALQNITKHAEAHNVEIEISGEADSIEISIADDGKGFTLDGKTRGLGLLNMGHRAQLLGGSFAVDSSPGQGTKIRVRVPLQVRSGESNLATR